MSNCSTKPDVFRNHYEFHQSADYSIFNEINHQAWWFISYSIAKVEGAVPKVKLGQPLRDLQEI